jgi:hypothetical protein
MQAVIESQGRGEPGLHLRVGSGCGIVPHLYARQGGTETEPAYPGTDLLFDTLGYYATFQ